MLITSIVLAIFVLSAGGILLIFIKKIPILNSLPQNDSAGIREHKIILALENRVKGILIFFEKQIFFHKFLSWVKIVTLKIEIRVDHLLHKIRKKAQQVDNNIKDKK